MLVYFVMLVFSCFFALQVNKIKAIDVLQCKKLTINWYAFLAFLPLFFVSAFRYMVGVDFAAYKTIFDNIVLYNNRTYVEVGFYWLIRLIGQFTTNSQWMFAVMSFLTMGIFVYALKRYSVNFVISVYLFVAMGFYFYSMSSIRYYFAVACAFFAGNLMREKHFVSAFGLIAMGFLFHKSVLIVVPVYLLCQLKFSLKYYFILAGIGVGLIALQPFIRNILFYFYSDYDGNKFDVTRISVYNVILSLVVVIWSFLLLRKILENHDEFYFNLSFFSFFFYVCCSWWIPESSRIGFYLSIYNILYIPRLIQYLEDYKQRAFVTVLVVSCYVLFLIFMLLKVDYSVGFAPFLPYGFCFIQ